MPIFAPRSIHILTKSKINKQCHQVRREKDIKWLPTSGKNVCAKTVIRRSHAKFLHCSFLQEEYLPLAGVSECKNWKHRIFYQHLLAALPSGFSRNAKLFIK